MALREKLYTAEEFFKIASLPENEEKRLELDDGAIDSTLDGGDVLPGFTLSVREIFPQ